MNKKEIKAVGIDLGTTNSCVAVIDGGEASVLLNEEGATITPSCVAFDMDKATGSMVSYIGEPAKRQAYANTKNTIYIFKRLMGKRIDEVQNVSKSVGYQIVANDKGEAAVDVFGQQKSPEYISGIFLQKLIDQVSKRSGYGIKDVVITVPANFNDAQRQATKEAGAIAGLNVLRIISEPTAAAMAYAAKHKDLKGNVLVYDLGGGTFDVSVVNIDDGLFQVKCTGGDMNLGGEDFDNIIYNYVVEGFKKDHPTVELKDPVTLYRIRQEAKAAKELLSSSNSANINVYYIAPGPVHIQATISRVWFEDKIKHHIESTIKIAKDTLNSGQFVAKDIDRGVLVGGSTRIKMIKPMLEEALKITFYSDVNPDTAIAEGAALQASILTGETKGIVLVDVTPLAIGIETVGKIMSVIVPQNSTIPSKHTQVFTTTADNQDTVKINVYQGNRPMVTENKHLHTIDMVGLKKMPRGVPKINVTFKVDSNGILHVTATEEISGVVQEVQVTMSNNKEDEEIKRMMMEAEEQKERDEEVKKLALTKVDCETTVYDIEKQIEQVKQEDKKSEFATQLNELRVNIETDPFNTLPKLNELRDSLAQHLGQQPADDKGPEQPDQSPQDDQSPQ